MQGRDVNWQSVEETGVGLIFRPLAEMKDSLAETSSKALCIHRPWRTHTQIAD